MCSVRPLLDVPIVEQTVRAGIEGSLLICYSTGLRTGRGGMDIIEKWLPRPQIQCGVLTISRMSATGSSARADSHNTMRVRNIVVSPTVIQIGNSSFYLCLSILPQTQASTFCTRSSWLRPALRRPSMNHIVSVPTQAIVNRSDLVSSFRFAFPESPTPYALVADATIHQPGSTQCLARLRLAVKDRVGRAQSPVSPSMPAESFPVETDCREGRNTRIRTPLSFILSSFLSRLCCLRRPAAHGHGVEGCCHHSGHGSVTKQL